MIHYKLITFPYVVKCKKTLGDLGGYIDNMWSHTIKVKEGVHYLASKVNDDKILIWSDHQTICFGHRLLLEDLFEIEYKANPNWKNMVGSCNSNNSSCLRISYE